MLNGIQFHLALLFLLGRYGRIANCSLISGIEKSINSRFSLGRCLETVGEYFFHSRKEIVIAITDKVEYNSDFPKYISDFVHKKYWTSYTSNMFYLKQIPSCYDKNYIFEVQDLEDLIRTFKIMRQSDCWNPNQYIYVYSSSILTSQVFRNMVNYVNQQYLTNIVIMFPQEHKFLSFQIYYRVPKKHNNCALKQDSHEFFTCRFGHISTPQIYNNNETVRSCALKIKAIVWPPFVVLPNGTDNIIDNKPIDKHALGGFEIDLMNLISESLGIEIEYYPSLKQDWGRSFFNGTTTKTMQDFMMKKVDVAIGSFATTLSRSVLFRTSFPYSEEYVVCCVPSNSYVDIWSTLMTTATLQLFFFISMIYLFLTSMIWLICRRFNEKHTCYKKASTCYLYCFAILVGVSVKVLPQTRNARMFLIILIIFELFYVAFYESILTSVLLSPNLKEDIKSIGDIVDRNMTIYNEPENRRYFENITNKFGKKALSLWIDCVNATSCLEDVHKNRNKAICLGKTHKDFVTFDKIWKGKSSLSCIHHNLITYPVAMIMRRTVPFHKQINKIIHRCLSAGLVDKWISTSFYKRNKSYIKGNNFSSNLEFRNLKPVFILLLIGHLIALALATGEFIHHKFEPFTGVIRNLLTIKFHEAFINI